MNIESIIKLMKDTRIENATNLTIGEAIQKLNSFSESDKLLFSNGHYFDGTYDSYRGYYEDMYIGWDDEDKGFNTVGKLKEVLNDALDVGVMIGYKGGEFSIAEDTLLWFSTYGDTGYTIVDIQEFNGQIFVVVKEDN